MSMNRMYVTAAYGRVYKEKDEILTDWHEGKDFKVYQGPYCSNRDILRMRMSGFTHVCFIWQHPESLKVLHHDLELK